ncbi:T9SS type A sorting domain-containing protein [Brumimicrobium aurantiacum]|uniref:T9SS C-terminal target domain-containing protein n=1 Tax=Brumimicrobium aurantiacum TaxID=1737063 RepID=A0A3E1EVH4_9FLAO|nr:T9SS type A sorting domain-containing protein [Brumimicrobium aurantiacum]RFC53564.1 T9SS C-terminal target domain-containing protein [Brumimicrobium aurantiacum]
MNTNKILIWILAIINAFSISAQSDSIFTNLTSYKAEICTHAWDFEGLNQFEHLTVFSDDPISDTLRVKDVAGNVFANLWIDGRKTWLRVNSNNLTIASQFVFFPDFNNPSGYPLDEYFLLYDFDVLDTVVVGDTVSFTNSSKNVTFSIAEIDTIQINNVDKVRYSIHPMDDQWIDYLIEGIGGLHPFTPILYYGLFGLCPCEYEATYTSQTDTLILRDTMVFGGDSNSQFCQTASLIKNEKNPNIKIYPNPLTGNTFTIQADGIARIDEVKLYDNLGKEIEVMYSIIENTKSCTVSTPNLSKGFYTVEVVSETKHYRQKVIVR